MPLRSEKFNENRVMRDLVAERVGFEPTVRLLAHLISSQARSATPAPLRRAVYWQARASGNEKNLSD